MAKEKKEFVCSACGFSQAKWGGQCGSCREWNTLEERVVESKSAAATPTTPRKSLGRGSKPVRLKDVKSSKQSRILVTDQEFNRVMGGGIVRDSITIITAPPGAGKSTLLLMIAEQLGSSGLTVYYASGEESVDQIKERSNRVAPNIAENVWIQSETNMNAIEDSLNDVDPDILIIDSIQSMYVNELPARAGSPTQVDECVNRLIGIAKNPDRKRAIFIVGQMTKKDELAGNRSMEHAVDTVLYLEGERTQQIRYVYAEKNRFGETGEVALYSMEQAGMIPITNPSEFFMTKRKSPVPGSALTVTREGTRNIVVEVESLTESSMYGFPIRVSEGINKQNLQIMTAIVERSGVRLSDKDVYVKFVAGMKPKETSVNLGIAMSIVSSVHKMGIPTDTVFIGEVGLTGEIKNVPYLETRIKELDRLGFHIVYIPKGNLREPIPTKNLKVMEVGTLNEAISSVFSAKSKAVTPF